MLWLLLLGVCEGFYRATQVEWKDHGLSTLLVKDSFEEGLQVLNFTLIYQNERILRFQVKDLQNSRWEVPMKLPEPTGKFESTLYSFELNPDPFFLKVYHKSKLVYYLDYQTFLYKDKELVVQNSLDKEVRVYGLGERAGNFPLKKGTYTLMSLDASGPFDEGTPGRNMYSSQPFFLVLDSSGHFHGELFLNSDPMDAYVAENGVKFRTIGGIIDYFVLVGNTSEAVVKEYHNLVGLPTLPPFWALGWHHCRWGYDSLTKLQSAVNNYQLHNLPLDVLWMDIDYMENYTDFTVDSQRFPELYSFVTELQSQNRKVVPIIDAAVAKKDYEGFVKGAELDVFIKSPNRKGYLLGSVWPETAVFIDWLHPNSTSYWHSMLRSFYAKLPFNGLWIDMNEPSNFCNGECGYETEYSTPYVPGHRNLNFKTVDLKANHHGNISDVHIHNLYGHYMAVASSEFLSEELNQRPFVVTRSSFVGTGKFASKWLGDNFSEFAWMKNSIQGIFNFQMFGIPLVGSDICGFSGNATEELCARWMQLGALYPFSRQHNSIWAESQEPWMFGDTLLSVSEWAIRTKYSLVHYYYTLIFLTSLEGGLVFKPVFMEFELDTNLYEEVDAFMLGPSLIVHPVLEAGKETLDAYFPESTWYNWYSGEVVPNGTVELQAPLKDRINIHIRGGCIVPLAQGYQTALTLEEVRQNPIDLVVALDSKGFASGKLAVDDGVSLGTIQKAKYTLLNYTYTSPNATKGLLSIEGCKGYEGEAPKLDRVLIYGCSSKPSFVYSSQQRLDLSTGFDPDMQTCWFSLEKVSSDSLVQLEITFELVN